MKTTAAILTLTISFLSAGAFAGSNQYAAHHRLAIGTNVTVIEKNQNWPVLLEGPAKVCAVVRCVDI
jgi:hypothetical protein